MDIQRIDESPLTSSARTAYRSVRFLYRKVRSISNHLCNLIDRPIIVLLYHRVTDLPSDPEMLAVSPANFHHHMEFLAQKFRIIRFEEDWSGLEKPAVAITFDDGYADNVLEALPILEKVGVPATFFVSTGHIGTKKEFWWHRLEAFLLREGEFPSHFRLDDDNYGQTWDTATLEQRKMLYAVLNMLMQGVSTDRREEWLDQLQTWAEAVDSDKISHRSMTQDEIRRLAASPWATVGAHTVTHSALSALSEEQQKEEIFTSKQALEEMTGKEISTFSYPFGRKEDYNQTSVRLCREAGFVKAASNFPGQIHNWTDPFQLPRHLVRNWDLESFAAKVESFWTR